MKINNYTFWLIGVLCLLCSSCEKFLSTEPKDFLTPTQYYNTQEELDFALNGVYEVLGTQPLYYNFMTSHFGAEADEGFMNSISDNAVQLNTFSSSHSFIQEFWKALYVGISRANYLLSYMDKSTEVSKEKKEQIRGEALFLRAYYYFLLVTYFGDVPITVEPILTASNNNRLRNSSVDVYKLIEKDMMEAESLVKSATSIGFGGRVSKSTVRGILSRVYLHWAGYPLKNLDKYNDAAYWSKKVMDDTETKHKLNSSYQQVFINYMQDLYDVKESIWEVEFWGNGSQGYFEQSWHSLRMGIRGGNDQTGFSYDFFRATASLYTKYEPFDKRRDWAIAPYYFTGGSNKVNFTSAQIYDRNVGKYRREYELNPKVRTANSTNYPLLRYADVLLMYAEAENQINGPTQGALDALNEVRIRAEASLFQISDFSDKISFLKVIQDERARELCFEAMRKQDLIRWGIYLDVMPAIGRELERDGGDMATRAISYQSVQPKHLLFPIPAREMSLNTDLVQNPGW